MTDITKADIAAAVQGHIKALRILGREYTSIEQVADALRLSSNDVATALRDFSIKGAKIAKDRCVIYQRTNPVTSPVIELKRQP